MTEPAPIPLEEFTAALETLDRAEFASFVGELRAATADDVTVEPPLVTVRTGGTQTELLVATPDSELGIDPDDVDGIVTTAERSLDDDVDATTVTPSDLRQRLLWARPVDDAQALCEETLGMPAYAARYADTPSSGETTATDSPQRESAPRRTGRPVLLATLATLVVLAAGAGGVYVTGTGNPVAAFLGADDGGDDPPSGAEPLEGSDVDEDPADGTVDPGSDPDATSGRNAALEPTCTRSFLHVVQIQLNALKYNNDTTNDGIRTVRQFASPANRQAVGTVEDYARLIKDGPYASMLSYDSVKYTPRRTGDTALVEVVTYENGTETGQYEFRLSTSRPDTERYDGCWMTDGVSALSEGRARESSDGAPTSFSKPGE